MSEVNLSTIRSDTGLTGAISFSQIRNLSPNGAGSTISFNKINSDNQYKGLTSYNPGTATQIKSGTGSNTDGLYWVSFNGTKRRTFCLLNSKWFGGGWIGLDPTSFPVSSNNISSASWIDNTSSINFFGFTPTVMPKILQVNVSETSCGGNSFYAISPTNTTNTIAGNAERMLFMSRFGTIGQCARIIQGTSMGYVDNPSTFTGESQYITYSGVCRWGDNIWAGGDFGAGSSFIGSTTNLKRHWIFRSRTNSNTGNNFQWNTTCGYPQTGTHYHMWFIRENQTTVVPTFALNTGRTLVDPAQRESFATTSGGVLWNLAPIDVGGISVAGSYTFNTTNSGIIRLNNTSSDRNANTARVNVGSRAIRSISVWYFLHSRPSADRYFLDARNTLANGWIYSYGIGSDWTTSSMFINNSSTSTTITWGNFDIENQWRCVTLVRPSAYTGTLNLFSRVSNNEGYNVSFGPIYISNTASSGTDHLAFYNQYRSRYGL
jgi:hypothetical protein